MANRNIERAVRVALFAAGAAGAGVHAPATLAQEQEIEQIVVTGSRIPQPNIEGTSPISVIGSQEIALQGVTRVENLVNNLPQAFADQGGNISNGATGTATVNLRNLGAGRTLVLVNGRRLPPGSPRPGGEPPDLNQIPSPLIERVEVLTGGASAVYGSDAVAGVVNFIMKDDFEGVQLDANVNSYSHTNDSNVARFVQDASYPLPGTHITSDGDGYQLSLLMGSNFADDRGNATFYVGYREDDALRQSERDYSACALGSTTGASGAYEFACLGSSTSNNERISGLSGTVIGLTGGGATRRVTMDDTTGAIRPFSLAQGGDLFNYAPYNYYQRPDERWSAAAFANYNLTESATVYGEFMFHDDRTNAVIAPSGMFGFTANTDCNNPLLGAAWTNAICTSQGLAPTDSRTLIFQRRNVEGGGRDDDIRHTSYQGVVGVKGAIGDAWNYDVFGSYGTVAYSEVYRNEFSITRSQRALDVITDPATGQPACRAFVDGSDPDCVPYNIWATNGITQEMLGYVQVPGFQKGETLLKALGATFSSDLGKYGIQSPWAASGIGFAVGVDYNEYSIDLETDTAFSTGDLAGQGGPTIGVGGGYNILSYFAEARVPIVEDVFLADTLSLNLSYRYSDYSDPIDDSTDTYGIGLDWGPIESFKLRGSYQRAVRAPSVSEIYTAPGLGLYDMDSDPCGGATPVATLEQCARTGVTAAQYGDIESSPAAQYNALFGGSLDLKPETADTYTLGFVFTPTFLDGFSLSVDYFDIKVEDAIALAPSPLVLSNCLLTGNPVTCGRIHRDSEGSLWFLEEARIDTLNENIGEITTSGVDLDVNYSTEIGAFGSLSFNLIGTYLDEFTQEPLPGLSYDCVGLYGQTYCGTPVPEWRHKFRVSWTTPWNLDLSVAWRFIDDVSLDRTDTEQFPDEALLGGGIVVPAEKTLDAQDYIDFAAAYTFMESYTVRLGMNNILDTAPPVSSKVGAGFGNGNTYPQVYDALGRYMFLGLTAKF